MASRPCTRLHAGLGSNATKFAPVFMAAQMAHHAGWNRQYNKHCELVRSSCLQECTSFHLKSRIRKRGESARAAASCPCRASQLGAAPSPAAAGACRALSSTCCKKARLQDERRMALKQVCDRRAQLHCWPPHGKCTHMPHAEQAAHSGPCQPPSPAAQSRASAAGRRCWACCAATRSVPPARAAPQILPPTARPLPPGEWRVPERRVCAAGWIECCERWSSQFP